MSSQTTDYTELNQCCHADKFAYDVTHVDRKNNGTKKFQICKACWDKTDSFRLDESTTKHVKIWQFEALEVFCRKCHLEVTKQMRCIPCNGEEQ